MQRTSYTLLSAVLLSAFVANACGGDDDDNGDTMNDGGSADDLMDDAVGDDPGDGMDAPGDGMDAPGDGMDDGNDDGGQGQIGADCTAASDCAENFCLMFESMGQQFGFCSRQCTSADDCPEEGWECNLAPYTACVPAQG